MKHINESKEAKEFLTNAGIKIKRKACHNCITPIDVDGNELTLIAESDVGIAAGIPGIYVEG